MADPNDILEPEERTGATPTATMQDTDILTEDQVHERGHATVSATGPTVNEWKPPPYQPGMGDDAALGGEKQPEPQPSDFVNPDMMDLPEDEKLAGATYMADMAIEIYGEGKKELGNLLLPIKNRRLRRLEEKGLIDQDIMLPRRDGGYAPASDFIDSYNQKATDVFGVREKFRSEVRPILIQEFAKKGIGLTPWQRIGFAIFMDLKEDMKIAMGLRAMGEEIIETMKEMTETIRQNAHIRSEPAPAAPVAEQPPAQHAQQAQAAAHVFDPSNPAKAFDDIQAARGGAAAQPPPANTSPGNSLLKVKRPRKRAPYKKKDKPVKPPITTIEITPNN